MSYPPYRSQYEGSSYERDDDRRRARSDEERDFRQREREAQRFRRDLTEGFESEDRPFEGAGRFRGRGPYGEYEDWEQPRRFGSEWGRGGQGQGEWRQSESQRESQRRSGPQRGEWQQGPERFGRGEGGGYFGEGGYFGGRSGYGYGGQGGYEGGYGQGGYGGQGRRFEEGEGRRFEEGGPSGRWRGSESGQRGYGGYGGGEYGGSSYGGGYGEYGGSFGGERGQFAGRGPKNYRRSDQRIQEEVCDRLTSDPQVDASEIQVTVKDGEITLEGTVHERRMKRLAEDVVESVAGVSQVHNRIRIEERGRSQGSESESMRSKRESESQQGSTSSSRQSSSRSV